MKRFSEQFKKKSEMIRMRASERADLRERITAYMEYHPLPAEMRTQKPVARKAVVGIPSEAFRSISINMHYLQGFAGVFAVLLIVGVPIIAERTVPGDMLYPVKTNITEEVRASLKLSPYAKVEWETQRLERRIAEARLLANEGKLTAETEAEVAKAVQAHNDAAQKEIAQIRESDADEAAIAEIAFASALEVQSEVLEGHIAQTDEDVSEEGTSVVALASVVSKAAGVAGDAQGLSTPSYERLLARVETESTHAYELFVSVQASASPAEVLDIERRLADIERKVSAATTAHDAQEVSAVKAEQEQEEPEVIEAAPEEGTEEMNMEETVATEVVDDVATGTALAEVVVEEVVPEQEEVIVVIDEPVPAEPAVATVDSVALLREALKDLRKLISFMTDIDVRETVTIEKLVPVVLTHEERLADATSAHDAAKALLEEIDLVVVTDERAEKVEQGTIHLRELLAGAEKALAAGATEEAAAFSSEAYALAVDIRALIGETAAVEPAEPEIPELETIDEEAGTTDETTVEEIDIEPVSETELTEPESEPEPEAREAVEEIEPENIE